MYFYNAKELSSIEVGCFISCIQMDAYADEHAPEGKMIPATYFQVLQAVVVQDTVVDTLTGCAFTVYFPVFVGIPGDTGMETEIAVILYINGAAITAAGTFFNVDAGIYAAAF